MDSSSCAAKLSPAGRALLPVLQHAAQALMAKDASLDFEAAMIQATEAEIARLRAKEAEIVAQVRARFEAEGGAKRPAKAVETATEKFHAGTLAVIREAKKQVGKIQDFFLNTNLLGQFLKQDIDNAQYKTRRPLVDMPNFLSAWLKDPMLPLQYVEEGEAVLENEHMKTALNSLEKHLEAWVPLIDGKLALHGGSANHKSEDLMQFLQRQTGQGGLELEENIKTAMAASAYSWLVSQVNAPAWKTESEIAKMHGRGKDAKVSPDGQKDLRGMLGFEDRVIHELGEGAVQMLGLSVDENAPGDLLPRLKMALGTHILVLLASPEVNMVQRTQQLQDVVDSYFLFEGDADEDSDAETELPPAVNGEAYNSYVKLAREDKDGRKLSGALQRIRDANVQSRGIVDRLFGSDKAPRVPGTTPAKFTQKYAKHTQQEISKSQAKAIQESMDDPFRPIPEMMYAFMALGREHVLRIAGHVDLESGFVHERNRDSYEAQNMNLENQFDLGMETLELDPQDLMSNFTADVLTTPRYITQNVWKNFRAGFSNAGLNPQTSKIHRTLFAREGWKATLRMSDTDAINEFKIAVAMNLGVKTDEQRNDATLAKFEAKLKEEPEILQAVELLRRGVLQGDQSVWTDEARALVAGVAANAEGMASFQALVAYAKYEQARIEHAEMLEQGISGDTEFDVTMLVGVDGKTNGPMLSHLALGAGDSLDDFYVMLNRGGFYSTDEGQADHYSQYYEGAESQDLYENLGARIVERVTSRIVPANVLKQMNAAAKAAPKGSEERKALWSEYFKHFTIDDLRAIEAVTKQLVSAAGKATKDMRKLTKVPLTSFAFGSSLRKSVDNMKANFIEGFYSKLEDLASSKASDEQRQAFIKQINHLIQMGDFNAAGVPANMPIEGLLKYTLSPEQEMALRRAFDRVIGRSVKEEMEDYFATFIKRRKQLNNTIQASYQVYEAAFAAARMQEIERLMDAGELPWRMSRKDGVEFRMPMGDLSPKQDRALRKKLSSLLPVMHSHYSIKDNNLGAGLYMAKSRVNVSRSPLYKSKVYVNTQIPRMVTKGGVRKQESYPHLVSQAQTRVEQSPGVAGAAYSIHSSDSSIMHQMLAKVKGSLNVHDEGGNGVHMVKEVARGLNQATAETFLDYSPAREAAFMLERVITNLAKQVRAGEVGPEAVVKLINDWAFNFNQFLPAEERLSPDEAAQATLYNAVENAFLADHMRLSALAKLKSVDQYVWEGGQFVADDTFRAKAQAKLGNLSPLPGKAVLADLAYLTTQYALHKDTKFTVAPWIDIKEEASEQEQAPEVTQTAKPADKKTAAVAELGQPAIQSDAKLVAAFAKQPVMTVKEVVALLKGVIQDDSRRLLLGQLERTVGGSLTVQYVTPDTDPATLMGRPNGKTARAWINTDPKTGKMAMYVLSPDFKYSGLTDEVLLHEMTHAALLGIVGDRGKSPEAKQLVDELNLLLKEARAFLAKDKELMAKYKLGVENVDELIAYGMSNYGFQEQVLKAIQMESKTGTNRLVTAMQRFIDAITTAIFGRHNTRMATGMEVLVQNVAGLFEAVAELDAQTSAPWDLDSSTSADMAMQGANVRTMDSNAIYSALAKQGGARTVSAGFDRQLRNLLDGIVTNLHGPFGVYKDLIATTQATDPVDIWLEAMATGVAPFASDILQQSFPVSEQEAFVLEQVEATLRTALADNEGHTTVAYAELVKLYDEVQTRLTVQDFVNAGFSADLYDYVFKVEAGADNKSDYLVRFASLGLAHEQFASLLGFATASAPARRAGQSFVERLHGIFEQILSWFNGRFTQTFAGQNADEKLASLVNSLVQIEVKKRHKLGVQRSRTLEHAEEMFRDVTVKARGQVGKFGRSRFFQNSRFAALQAVGTGISLVADDRIEVLLDGINEMRDQNFKERHGLAMGVLNEVRGANESNLPFHGLIRGTKRLEGRRKELIDNTARVVLESFANGGAGLTKEQKAAITSVFLRTDMSALLGAFTVDELGNLLKDPKALEKAIASYEAQLAASPYRNFYMNAAEALGFYKARGLVRSAHLLMNAGNIARLYGTSQAGKVNQQQAEAMEKIIDPLASLYALAHLPVEQVQEALGVFQQESARTDKGNGIEMVLKLHKALQQQSRERLFQASEALQMKGYTTEIYNPYLDVVVANDVEGADLIAQGYAAKADVAIDPADPDQEPKKIYVLRDGGLQPHLTGVFSYSGMQAKGTRKHNGNVSLASSAGMQNASMMHQLQKAKQQQINAMFHGRIRPNKVSTNYLAPVMNAQGDVANYRYLMAEATKDEHLERDNRFERVLGAMAGSIYDKEASPKQNRAAVEALKAQYDAEYATKTASYIKIGPAASDPEMREIWRLLPESTKQAVRDVWGREEMMVRIDLLDINFGYRKLSLANMFQKDEAERAVYEQLFVDFWSYFLGPKAELRIRQAEDIWQTIVREAKDIIVVKSGMTLLGNVMSNVTELMWFGISPAAIVRHHRVAMKGAMAYRKDSKELFDLENQLSTGYLKGNRDEIEKRVVRLKDALARNPVRHLIDAGLMPTIVEDVAAEDEIYSYKSRFNRLVDKYAAKLNPTVVKAARLAYMTHDTQLYKAMSYGTQLSDFVARYTLYQHMTQRSRDPMAHEDAVQLASDAFINYDVPSHRSMQYLNDTGLVWFTKYYLRIQKVIMHLYRENPGRALALLTLNSYFDWIPTLMDSAASARIGNPFSLGAFNYSPSQLATVKVAMSPFN